MVTREQHGGHTPVTELSGTRVLRVLQQPTLERLLGQRLFAAEHSRNHAGHRVDEQHRGQLTPGDHHVPDAHLDVHEVGAHPLVHALVPPADDEQARLRGQFGDQRAIQSTALRGHQHHLRGCLGERLDRLDGSEQRLRLHHHPRPAAERVVVYRAVLIDRP